MQMIWGKFVPHLLMGMEEQCKFSVLKIKMDVWIFYGQGSFQREIGAKEEFSNII